MSQQEHLNAVASRLSLLSILIHPGRSGDSLELPFNARIALSSELQQLEFSLLQLAELSDTLAI